MILEGFKRVGGDENLKINLISPVLLKFQVSVFHALEDAAYDSLELIRCMGSLKRHAQ